MATRSKTAALFSSQDELKQFILWAKSVKVAQLKVGDVEIVFLPISLLDDQQTVESVPDSIGNATPTANKPVNELNAEDEEALFWSTR